MNRSLSQEIRSFNSNVGPEVRVTTGRPLCWVYEPSRTTVAYLFVSKVSTKVLKRRVDYKEHVRTFLSHVYNFRRTLSPRNCFISIYFVSDMVESGAWLGWNIYA